MANQADDLQAIEHFRNRVAVLRDILVEAEWHVKMREYIYSDNLANGEYRPMEDKDDGETSS